jgi:hypothetical protein
LVFIVVDEHKIIADHRHALFRREAPGTRRDGFHRERLKRSPTLTIHCESFSLPNMSEKRPRRAHSSSAATSTKVDLPANAELQRWMRRVFQNSYSYRGTLRRVRGWSVKIQYQGHRRTFSLHSKDRIAAAEEAARLYQEIITEGWPPRKNPGATTPSLRIGSPEMTRSFWQQRLMRRPYPVSAGTSPWVVRMEHEGSSA